MKNGEKYLITTNNYFYGPDGEQYRAVYGVVQIKEAKDVFGFTPNVRHTNWITEVGTEEKKVVVTGCEVLYALKLDTPPTIKPGTWVDKDGEQLPHNRIYIAE